MGEPRNTSYMSLPVPAPKPCAPGRFRAGLRLFEPAPSIPVTLSDPAAIAKKYKLWQVRVLFFSILGYATFYLVRKNLGIAMPFMGKELGITKESLGLFLTLHGVLYGVSKFANGFLADRANARVEEPAELPDALQRALKVVKEERRQALVNVVCKNPLA